MGICNDQICNCAIRSTTLTVSGSGTPGDPWVLEQAEFTDITQLENDVANIEATLATLPSTYVDETGDTMSGTLTINHPSAGGTDLILINSDGTPILSLRDQTGAQMGLFQGQGSSSLVRLFGSAGIALALGTDAVERMRLMASGQVVVGKTTTDGGATTGIEFLPAGSVISSRAAVASNFISNKTSSADVNGGVHLSVQSAGTQIGSITRATASTTAFNTSSDEEKKQNIRAVPDTQALNLMRQIEPFLFEWTVNPTDPTIGYIAQRVAAAWPESVKHGLVTPPDPAVPVNSPEYRGWQMDYSKIVPLLHAAMQAMDRRFETFKTQATNQIQQLQSDVAALTARVAALEAA